MSKLKGDPGYRAEWCIHYRPPSIANGDTCEAGIAFSIFEGTTFAQRPCFLDAEGQSKPGALWCVALRRPTAEEIEAHEAWSEERSRKLMVVMVGIAPWRMEHQNQNFAEVVECPECKGRLHLSIARSNSHVHAHCETEGCVSWME
jgi:hypothetical protein